MNPRLQGVLVFAAGVCLAVVFWNEYHSGSELFSAKLLIMTPVILLLGLTYILEPRVLLASKSNASALPILFKVVNYVLLFVGLAIGFYIRYVVFKEWHR